MTRRCLVLGLVLLTGGWTSQRPREVTSATAAAIDRWIGAVLSHVPGEADGAVQSVWLMTGDDREQLHPGMTLLLDAVTGRRVTARSIPETQIAAAGRDLAKRPGAAEVLKRAAVLHGDAAMRGFVTPDVRPVPDDPPPQATRSEVMNFPLLVERYLWLENDGQIVGMSVADWNWVFARSLFDRLRPGADPFVAEWYHAAAAFMFKHRIFGEISWHLERAAEILPADARILLDRGCSAEHQGLPRSQSALGDEAVGALRLNRAGRINRSVTGPDLGIEPVEVSNRNAENFFRRAVDRDPRLFEARVRLARLLNLKSKYAEALAVIVAAPTGTAPDVIAEYYAHLFAARAERGLGRLDAAAARISEARALFPDAQSALMAASHIAMLRADEAGADEPMQRLAQLPFEREDDPWWGYEMFTGRYAETLIAAMWKNSPR